jgi:hypothetical protein
MYEAILSRIDALTASLGLSPEGQRVRSGENPWGYTGGIVEESSHKGRKEEVRHKKVAESESDGESVESTFTMVEKTELGR